MTDVNGAIVESYRYEAFGKPTVYNATGTASASSAYGNRFEFTGREFISEIGIYDYRNRNYSSEIGRFLQNDSIRFEAGDVNLYRYVGNDALMITDPTGEFLRAILDFLQNYSDMREANTIDADKYFHCMANCQASSYGGFLGINDEVAAKVISELREYFDEYAKNDSPEVCNEDRAANHHGQDAPDGADCTEWCSEFRPNGLSDDY